VPADRPRFQLHQRASRAIIEGDALNRFERRCYYPDMNELARNSDPVCLHPIFREKARELLDRLTAEGIPFRLYEGFRSPERQRYLYAQGRTRAGPIITYARPWASYHQYGMAGDFVLFENGTWTWDTRGFRKRYWAQLQTTGKQLGLEPLPFELPHLQLAGIRIQELAAKTAA